jgi:AcrR family transcriptional regulator
VSRWQPDASDRLKRAAFELFVEVGFAETTVPQITARAGLTTRTFFRYFPDKRDVLFAEEADLPGIIAKLMTDLPASHNEMTVVARGLDIIAAEQLNGALDYLRMRRSIISTDEGLRERELRRQSVLLEAIHRGFLDRGVTEPGATVASHLAVTVFSVSVERWLDEGDEKPLTEILHETLASVQAVAAEPVE